MKDMVNPESQNDIMAVKSFFGDAANGSTDKVLLKKAKNRASLPNFVKKENSQNIDDMTVKDEGVKASINDKMGEPKTNISQEKTSATRSHFSQQSSPEPQINDGHEKATKKSLKKKGDNKIYKKMAGKPNGLNVLLKYEKAE